MDIIGFVEGFKILVVLDEFVEFLLFSDVDF